MYKSSICSISILTFILIGLYSEQWYFIMDFPDSSAGKESACNARDPGSIRGSERSAGEGIGYPFQFSWASLVAQLAKNPLATWETWVRSLGSIPGLGRSPEKGKGYPLQYSDLENFMNCIVHGLQRVANNINTFILLVFLMGNDISLWF